MSASRPFWLRGGHSPKHLGSPAPVPTSPGIPSGDAHRLQARKIEEGKSKEKRTQRKDEAFDPTAKLRNWREYLGEFRAVITIRAAPKLRETFWSAMGRGLVAASGNYSTTPATLKFKTDFLRMELLCGSKPIMPILPGKIVRMINVRSPFVNATDATYEGFYTYPVSAFSPQCGQVVLRIFSEKEPTVPTLKVLEAKTVDRVWMDFEGWRQRPNFKSEGQASGIAPDQRAPAQGNTDPSRTGQAGNVLPVPDKASPSEVEAWQRVLNQPNKPQQGDAAAISKGQVPATAPAEKPPAQGNTDPSKTAEQGNVLAMRVRAERFFYGLGEVPKDNIQAQMWAIIRAP